MSEHSHAISSEWLALYYDGELDAKRREQVQAHLITCVSCQRELAALQSLSSMLAVDRLPDGALTSQAARFAWRKLEPKLAGRAAVTPSPVRWLPGVGLLLANGLAQIGAAASILVILVASQLPWAAIPLAWLNRTAASFVMGWLSWLLPDRWSDWGLAAFFTILSAWLAILYLIWLCYAWRYRWQPAAHSIA